MRFPSRHQHKVGAQILSTSAITSAVPGSVGVVINGTLTLPLQPYPYIVVGNFHGMATVTDASVWDFDLRWYFTGSSFTSLGVHRTPPEGSAYWDSFEISGFGSQPVANQTLGSSLQLWINHVSGPTTGTMTLSSDSRFNLISALIVPQETNYGAW